MNAIKGLLNKDYTSKITDNVNQVVCVMIFLLI